MEGKNKEEFEKYMADKLTNMHTYSTALKVCEIICDNCKTNKQVEVVLFMIKKMLDIPKDATLERYQ